MSQRPAGAPQQQTRTARMLQQHGRYLVFAFLDQELGEIEDPHIPVTGRERIAGRHGDVVYANQLGPSIIVAAADNSLSRAPWPVTFCPSCAPFPSGRFDPSCGGEG